MLYYFPSFHILYKETNVSIFSSKSGPLLISSCYTVQWSEALPVQKLGSNIGPWQPATPCDREVNKLPACFAVIFQGSCFCGGRGGVVSRTKPSLHPRASRIYRKWKEAGLHVGSGAKDWRHVRISCFSVKEIWNHVDLVMATPLRAIKDTSTLKML